jgi:hypothetical protein
MSSPQQPPPDPQAAQAGLAIMVSLAIAKLWPSLDLLHLRQALPAFKAAVVQEVQRHAQASATMAVRQYQRERVAAGVGSGFTPRPADPPPVEQIAQAVDWAVQPLWNSNVQALAQGLPEAEPTDTLPSAGSAIADAKGRLAAASERLVLNAGGDTIVDAVQQDRKAKGYVRITEANPCWLCAMLATRGVVYKSGSFEKANGRFDPHPDFPVADDAIPARAHDNCRCHLAPVFTAYEPTAEERKWAQTYKDAKPNPADGDPSKAKQIAFRRAFEGRTAPTK